MNGGRDRPLSDSADSVRLHRDAIRGNDETKEGHGGDVELALAELASQAIFTETRQDLFDVHYMLLERVREDEDVIQINDAEDVEEIAKTIVSVSLERSRSVGEAEGHNEVFEVAIAGTESGFVFVAFCNPQLVVCIHHIQPGKVFRIFEAVEKLRDEREGIAVLDCDVVELVIVDTKTEGAIRLFDEENWGTKGGLRWANESFGDHVVDIILQSSELSF